MTVYELIQELTNYKSNARVIFDLDANIELSDYEEDMKFSNSVDYDDIICKRFLCEDEVHIKLTY